MDQGSDLQSAGGMIEPRTIPRGLTTRSRFAGAVDHLDTSAGFRGWLVDTAAPGSAPAIDLFCGAVRLARGYAMMDRPDIDRVAGRLTQAGFLIGWSVIDVRGLAELAREGRDHPIRFFVAETGEQVPAVCELPGPSALLGLINASPLGDRRARFREVGEFREVFESGLLDAKWYRAQQGKNIDPGMPAALDYLRRGEAAGERPNFYFDPLAYARQCDLPSPSGALLHYLRSGGTRHLVSPHFDERWYRRRYDPPRGSLPLAHYLAHRREHAPNPFFDPDYYRSVSGEAELEDAYEHFVTIGFAAGLMPSEAIAAGVRNGQLPPGAAKYLAALRRELSGATPGHTDLAPPMPRPPPPAATPGPAAGGAAISRLPSPAGERAPGAEGEGPAASGEEPEGMIEPGAETTAVSAERMPAAARLGYEAARAWLARLPPQERAAAVAAAEAGLDAAPSRRADAALLLSVARQMEGKAEAAAEAAAIYFAAPLSLPADVAEATAGRLLADTHRLYEQRRRDLADTVYRAAYQAGHRDQLMLLRLIETGLDRGDIDRIAPIAAELEGHARQGLDPWAAIALGRYHHRVGNPERATQLLLGVAPFPAVPAHVEAAVLHRLAETGAVEEASARSEMSATDASPELFAARFRLAVLRRDAPALLAALGDSRATELRGWQIAEAMFRLTETGALPSVALGQVLRALNRLAEARGLSDIATVQARIRFLMHGKRWDELGALFEQLEGLPLAKDREILLRRLEYLCLADKAEVAEEVYRAHFRDRDLTKWEALTIMRLLSELHRWEEAAATLKAHVGRGFGFGGAGHMGMRIVRKAAMHEAVIAAAEAAPGHREPDLDSFVARVREDLAILQMARTLSANREEAGRGPRYRSNWIFDPGTEDAEEYGLFLCSNRRYFLSMLTFFCSFLGQAPQVGGRLFAFLDKDVPRHWHGAIAMVGARFGRAIEVVLEPDFVPRDVKHRVDFGFFAGGNNLSRAAYFRLYAARWLLQRHRFRRAAYIDTDTICRADLSGLFTVDLGPALIAAATEDYSAHVVKAASRNGLDPDTYFNSGVLLLKFDDPELPGFIDEAIRIAENEADRLVFQDQCALNLAFQGRVAKLPKRYNFFLRPSRERNGFIEDGVILHFLDKPKPWDVVFDKNYREEWRVWALMLGNIIPRSLYVDIFAEANCDD